MRDPNTRTCVVKMPVGRRKVISLLQRSRLGLWQRRGLLLGLILQNIMVLVPAQYSGESASASGSGLLGSGSGYVYSGEEMDSSPSGDFGKHMHVL